MVEPFFGITSPRRAEVKGREDICSEIALLLQQGWKATHIFGLLVQTIFAAFRPYSFMTISIIKDATIHKDLIDLIYFHYY